MTDEPVEVPPSPIEPLSPTAPVVTLVPEPVRWSPAAQRRLLIALIVGSVMVLGGLGLFFQSKLRGLEDVLWMYLGLALMPIGAGMVAVTVSALRQPPELLYRPRPVNLPRNLFVIIWIAGMIAPVLIHVQSIRELRTFSIVGLMLSSALVLSGGRWAYRWFTNKLSDAWPTGRMDSPPAVQLSWPRNWTVGWAGLFGVLAGVLAAILEIALIWVAANLLEPWLAQLQIASLDTGEIIDEVLGQPAILLGVFVGVAVIAPAIEEACKALGLRLLRSMIQRPLDGLMLGMLIGLGFGLMESGLYLSSMSGWLIGGWLRLSTLLLHGIATSIVGVAYTRSLISGQRREVVAGYGRAVLLHGVWNASAIGVGVGFNSAATWWLGFICLGILIFLLARMIPRAVLAGVETVVQEGYQQAGASLPPEWSPADTNIGWRLMGSQPRHGERVAREVVYVPVAPLPDAPPVELLPSVEAAPDESH